MRGETQQGYAGMTSRLYMPAFGGPRWIHAPLVKSGTGTGRPPMATDCSLRQVMAIHEAVSYTSMGGFFSSCTLSTNARRARRVYVRR